MRTAVVRRALATPAGKSTRHARQRRPLSLESLEPRTLLAALPADDPLASVSGHGGVCNCPVCTGVGLENIAVVSDTSAALAPTTSLAGLPQLSSNPSARAKLYLDFDGHVQTNWGSYRNVVTPAFDQDGSRWSFSSGELSTIREVWARVAEDYAPFNIDVTTIAPGSLADRVVAHVAIGGNWSDWYGSTAGGVAYVGGFANGMPNVAYVFEDALGNGNPRYLAEAISHEAGHLFGLQHQAVWNGNTLASGYNSGSGDWAPIMGTGYYADRTTWHRGTSATGPTAVQDDMAIIAGAANGFGWRADDFANSTSTAARLPAVGTSVNFAGLIGSTSDLDVWSLATGGGLASFQMLSQTIGGNLRGVLELRDAAGRTVATAVASGSLGAMLTTTLASGTYYLIARSSGGYGNVGQYTIRGTLPATTSVKTPEISLQMQGIELADASAVSFGTAAVGTSVTRTFTVTNKGTAPLSLTRLSTSGWPAGFSLASNLGSTSLAPGQSTMFSIRFSPTKSGTAGGQITLRNSDASESAFELRLSGSAVAGTATTVAAPAPTSSTLVKRIVDNGDAAHSRSAGWTRITGRGVQSDVDQAAKGAGTSYSTWSFPNLPNGRYQVYGSWTGSSTQASNAPFTLYNGSTPVATVRADQRVASSGLMADGASWRFLGNVTVTGGRLNVRLSNGADATVVADAIRIVQTASAAQLPGGNDPAAADLALLAWLDVGADEPQPLNESTATPIAEVESLPAPQRRVLSLARSQPLDRSLTLLGGVSAGDDEADDEADINAQGPTADLAAGPWQV